MAAESMLPTYAAGDMLNIELQPSSVSVGDVVLFYPPRGAQTNQCGAEHTPEAPCPRPTAERAHDARFVKRVVAKAGDTVALRDGGHVVRNGEVLDEQYILACDPGPDCTFPQPITVPADMVFVLGDNRGASDDSRFWGPVPRDWIIGKVVGAEHDPEQPREGAGPVIE